ncbi:MAG: hypothetical protein V8S39_13035 [Lachnospiraceae bacterium]
MKETSNNTYVERYFKEKRNSDYYFPLTNTAKKIIDTQPQYWEDKLFREVFRVQRQYLDSFLPIDPYNKLSQYVFGRKISDNLSNYIENIKESLTYVKKYASYLNLLVANINEARGCGIPGNAEMIVQCARDCFSCYIYHLEMIYDIKYIYMPGGDKIKQWLEESVMIIIKECDNYILDEFDIVANELAETGNCDRKMFQKQININLDLNEVLVEWVIATWSYEQMNRKVVHYIPIESADEGLLDNKKMILVTPEVYEEYIKLKNNEK